MTAARRIVYPTYARSFARPATAPETIVAAVIANTAPNSQETHAVADPAAGAYRSINAPTTE